ncbi:hypothetical protein JHN55_03800 [Streptomyces sp. MBT56]|uniref:hypothetical protein n=1 Tax=unclassified Streptomyces TaxID=2593676 RepID=UPI00190B23E1|nr:MULTISPECIES: hypothetical protein [unclassified Streptomyces]MBK3555683.1 hypothetical protein [Streptomyces sp. MBT56]MBK3602400.1 hypothetical protein [Streptomyces sp. MBT54]MBK3617295.1 hypothetical protein [Streptomyces sp. MBT98]
MTTCLMCDQPDEIGGLLCVGCTKATVVRLESLPALHRGLAPFLQPAGGVGSGRSGKGGPAPLPVNEDILDLRGPGGLVGAAERWLADVRRDRGHMATTPAGGIEARLQAAVAGLLANMGWIAVSWPSAGYFAKDIRDLVNSVRSIIAPAPTVAVGQRVGTCPALIPPAGTLCGAVLRLAPGEKALRCEWCGTVYPPYVWAQLKTWIDEDTKARGAA